MARIATVINFCTNDLRFLSTCIGEARRFSDQIIIPVSDHFFDGTSENFALLEWAYAAHPDCLFIEFSYDAKAHYYPFIPPRSAAQYWMRHWHNTSRWLSFYFLKEEIDYILFLDVDEIVESEEMLAWLQGFDYSNYAALRFASYWYFREAQQQATAWPDAGLLVKRAALHPDFFFDPNERKGLYEQIAGEKRCSVLGVKGRPLMHHYSWVRTKEEMLKKTATWGHHREKENWPRLIEEEFSREFRGADFDGVFLYQKVSPLFDPLQVAVPTSLPSVSLEEHRERIKVFSHVQPINRSEAFEKDLSFRFGIGS